MALPTTGPLSLSMLATEFVGTQPIRMSDYYKDGALVPSTVSTPAGAYGAYEYNGNSTPFYGFFDTTVTYVYYGGGGIAAPLYADNLSSGGYDYNRGAFVEVTGIGEDGYEVRRRTSAGTAVVNETIPISGVLMLSSYYGGRKT